MHCAQALVQHVVATSANRLTGYPMILNDIKRNSLYLSENGCNNLGPWRARGCLLPYAQLFHVGGRASGTACWAVFADDDESLEVGAPG